MNFTAVIIALAVVGPIVGLAFYATRAYANIAIERPGTKTVYADPDHAATICSDEFHRMTSQTLTLRFTKMETSCIAFEVVRAQVPGSSDRHAPVARPQQHASMLADLENPPSHQSSPRRWRGGLCEKKFDKN
jgi:hypothetical protein